MKKLINTIKKMEKILLLIEKILKKEYHFLLKVNANNVDILKLIIQEKEQLFKKFIILNQEKLLIEKKYDIFIPYEHQELYDSFSKIVKKCVLLNNLNRRNKILMNKNFYLNQNFLESFSSYKTAITYNATGDLKI